MISLFFQSVRGGATAIAQQASQYMMKRLRPEHIATAVTTIALVSGLRAGYKNAIAAQTIQTDQTPNAASYEAPKARASSPR